MLISLVPILSNGLAAALSAESPLSPRLVRSWKVALIASVSIFVGFWVYLGCGVPGISYGTNLSKLIGWEDLADKVSTIVAETQKTAPARVIVVGMDKHYTPAELNFYLHKLSERSGRSAPLVIGRSMFGLDCLMFEYWSADVKVAKDDVLVLVARSPLDLEAPSVVARLQNPTPVVEYRAQTHGKASGRYYYRIAQGFVDMSAASPTS
jgi:hypothetical protein